MIVGWLIFCGNNTIHQEAPDHRFALLIVSNELDAKILASAFNETRKCGTHYVKGLIAAPIQADTTSFH